MRVVEFRYEEAPRPHRAHASIRSRASCPTSSGAIARPNRRRCARNSRSISACGPARNAAARASTAPRASCSSPGAACRSCRASPWASARALPLAGRRGLARRSRCEDRAGRRRAPALPRRRRASTTSRSIAAPRRSRAAKRSASGSRARWAPGLTGVMYILDEPSIGLHQRDNAATARRRSRRCATPAIP